MIEYLFQNILALYIGGSIRYIYLRFICRKRDLSYNRVLHGITNAKTKEADTYNVKNAGLVELPCRHLLFCGFITTFVVEIKLYKCVLNACVTLIRNMMKLWPCAATCL